MAAKYDKNNSKLLKKSRVTYKNNYDERLRKHVKFINVDDYAYLGVERNDPNEHRDKLEQCSFQTALAQSTKLCLQLKERTVHGQNLPCTERDV